MATPKVPQALPFDLQPARGLEPNALLNKRTGDGSLVSVRIPVTRANRQLLQQLRAAELAAWQAGEHAHV